MFSLRRKASSRKRVWLLALLLLFLCLSAGALFWLLSGDSPLLRNFNQVREGMTRTEAESILGPPGNLPPTDNLLIFMPEGKKLVTTLRWRQDGEEAILHLDESGVVGMKVFVSSSPRDKARRWWLDTFGKQPPF